MMQSCTCFPHANKIQTLKYNLANSVKITLNPDVREKLAVPTSYAVTNIDKSCKNLLGDRGKKEIYVEGKQSIAI
jgi:hypothetical protein